MKAAAAVDGLRQGVLALSKAKQMEQCRFAKFQPKLAALIKECEQGDGGDQSQMSNCLQKKIKAHESRELGCGCTKCRLDAAAKAIDSDKPESKAGGGGCPKCEAAKKAAAEAEKSKKSSDNDSGSKGGCPKCEAAKKEAEKANSSKKGEDSPASSSPDAKKDCGCGGKKDGDAPKADASESGDKQVADLVAKIEEATKVIKDKQKQDAASGSDGKKDKKSEKSKDGDKKKSDSDSKKDKKAKDFSYITKAGSTANVTNVKHKGGIVTFDATFEDAKATANKAAATDSSKK